MVLLILLALLVLLDLRIFDFRLLSFSFFRLLFFARQSGNMSHALSLLLLLALCAEVSRVKLIRIFDKVRLCGEQVTLLHSITDFSRLTSTAATEVEQQADKHR